MCNVLFVSSLMQCNVCWCIGSGFPFFTPSATNLQCTCGQHVIHTCTCTHVHVHVYVHFYVYMYMYLTCTTFCIYVYTCTLYMGRMPPSSSLPPPPPPHPQDKGRDAMRNLLSQKPYQDVMCDAITILNPKLRVGNLKSVSLLSPSSLCHCHLSHSSLPPSLPLFRVQECRFYDSKMRPLLLVYENPDPSALLQDVHIIFKNGDGEEMVYVD